ncbi:hypothetical protein PBOI14_65720 [Pseudomonas sp. Boi14]|nr:hypothetical protein PBOI14_65720 [Pseudomonas sp. Boi14]
MDKKRSLVLASTAVVGLGLAALLLPGLFASPATVPQAEEAGHGAQEPEGHLELSPEQIQAAGIELAAAGPRRLNRVLSLPGEIRFDEDRTSHIVPRAAGVVESVQVNLGQAVKRGELLAVIASQQISDQRSELAAAGRRVELARTTFQRERQLWVDQISAEQDYLLARQALQEAEIALNNARQKMNALSGSAQLVGGNRYEMRAPFDGVVVEKHLSVGEVVGETSAAFTLSDLSRVWATFGVFPKDLDKVRVGQPVQVSSSELGTQVQGQVAYVGSLLGEQTRTATVRVTLANPNDAWRPGCSSRYRWPPKPSTHRSACRRRRSRPWKTGPRCSSAWPRGSRPRLWSPGPARTVLSRSVRASKPGPR